MNCNEAFDLCGSLVDTKTDQRFLQTNKKKKQCKYFQTPVRENTPAVKTPVYEHKTLSSVKSILTTVHTQTNTNTFPLSGFY